MTNQAIISLAILKVNWDCLHRDYLENFVPMAAECIRLSNWQVVTLPDLQRDMFERFGLRLPQAVVERLIKRCAKRRYLCLVNAAYQPDIKELSKLTFADVRQKAVEGYDEVVAHLARYKGEHHPPGWTDTQAEDALRSYLLEHQLLFIGARLQGAAVPLPTGLRRDGSRYIVGSFVQYLQATQSPVFAYLETVAKGHLLAQAAYLPDQEHVERRFLDTAVYLDTQLLMLALGRAGLVRGQPYVELVRMLKRAGSRVLCFNHTLMEMKGIHTGIAGAMAAGGYGDTYGPTVDYLESISATPSDVDLLSIRLEKDLKELGIEVVEKPDYSPDKYPYVIDEAEFRAELSRRIRYKTERPLYRDIESISAVMRLRKDHRPTLYEQSKALFVTTNSGLAALCQSYFCNPDDPDVIPPCITDRDLATILWLKMPFSYPQLPGKLIIADCYAAMEPDENLWHKYLAEVEKVQATGTYDADDVRLLRRSLEAKQALMDLTLGGEEPITEGTVADVLARVKARLDAASQAKMEGMKDELQGVRSERDELRELQSTQGNRIAERSQRLAAGISKGAMWGVIPVLTVTVASTFPWWPHRAAWQGTAGHLAWGAQVALLLLYVASLYRGTTVKGLASNLERRLARRIEHAVKAILS